MTDFGVTCIYDELLGFKKSVAVVAAQNIKLTVISNAADFLVQVVLDNFDANVSPQNGKLSTHSLTVLMTQPAVNTHQHEQPIPCIINRDGRNWASFHIVHY